MLILVFRKLLIDLGLLFMACKLKTAGKFFVNSVGKFFWFWLIQVGSAKTSGLFFCSLFTKALFLLCS
jgi:hypothetical protein